MEMEDELIALEAIGINAQAAASLVSSNPIGTAILVALIGTAFCYVKVWHRHREARWSQK